MQANQARRLLHIVGPVAIVVMAVDTAQAVLVELSAKCESSVVEKVDGETTTTATDLQRYPESVSTLPMQAEARVVKRDPETDEVQGIGVAFSQFKDPRRLTDGVPDELNIDAGAFSAAGAPHYEVDAVVVEQRKILPTPEQTGRAVGEEVVLTSTFYIRGLLAAVAQHGGTDLTGLLARVKASVVHKRPDQPAVTVMTATYQLVGRADGTVALQALDSADASQVLSPDLGDYVAELDMIKVALIPSVEIDYDYAVTVGTESDLTAILTVELLSVPGGTGVGAAFGTNGQKIGETIDAVVGGTAGSDAVRAINNVIGTLPPRAIPFLIGPTQTLLDVLGFLNDLGCIGSSCGVFSVEALMAFAVMTGWVGARRRR